MTTRPSPSIPDLSDDWVARRRDHLVRELTSRPRRRPALNLTIGAVATAAAATAAITLFLVAGPGAHTAFAGWKAAPTPASAGQRQDAETACRQRIANSSRTATGSTTKPARMIDPSSLRLALTDTRGPYSLLLFDGSTQMICLAGPSFNSITGAYLSSSTSVPVGQILVGRTSYGGRPGIGAFTVVEGRVSAGVSAVSLQVTDGSQVDSTVANGWFAAWWPNSHGITSATITTPTGTHTQTLNISGPQIPPGSKNKP
jgi:hypothetical protein